MFQFIENIDVTILKFIQDNMRIEWLTPFFRCITHFGDAIVVPFITLALIVYFRKNKYLVYSFSTSIILEVLLNDCFLKDLFHRIRPYDMYDFIFKLVPSEHDFSFPSGHTGASFALAFAIYFNAPKKYGIPALIYATFIGFSRLYVGVHYPSDVIAGIVLGFITAFISTKIWKIIRKYLEKKKSITENSSI